MVIKHLFTRKLRNTVVQNIKTTHVRIPNYLLQNQKKRRTTTKQQKKIIFQMTTIKTLIECQTTVSEQKISVVQPALNPQRVACAVMVLLLLSTIYRLFMC